MIKTVKGFINKGKKGSTFSIAVSVYNGADADKVIQEKIINSYENFGFKKGESKNDEWISLSLWASDITTEEKERLVRSLPEKKRVTVTISKRKDKKGDTFGIVSFIDNNDETHNIMEGSEKELSLYGYINKLDNNSIALSTSVKVDDENVDNKVNNLLAIGFTEGESKNENWRSFSLWINKPSEYEQELVKENGRFKYTLKVIEHRDNITKIDSLIAIEDIPDNVSDEDKTKADDEAEF